MTLLLMLFTALTPQAEALIEEGIEASRVEDYDAARAAYNEAKRLCPDDPAPYFLDGALTFIYMSDFVTDSEEDYFDQQINTAELLAKTSLNRNGENARDLLFIGSVRIFRMTRYGWKRQYVRAMNAGLAALDPLQRAVDLNPTLYDAYLALGAYHYFQGNVGRYIPGMRGNATVEQGIREVRLVYENGVYFEVSAGQALSFMLKEEGRSAEALSVSRALVNRWPEARTFRWGLGDLYIDLEMWEAAIELYTGLLRDVRDEQPGCYTNIYQIKLKLAYAYAATGNEVRAKRYCTEIIDNRHRIRRDLGYSDIVRDAEKFLASLE